MSCTAKGNAPLRAGVWEISETFHLKTLGASISAGAGAAALNWWNHDAGPILLNLIQQGAVFAFTTGIGLLGAFLKHLVFDNREKTVAAVVVETKPAETKT